MWDSLTVEWSEPRMDDVEAWLGIGEAAEPGIGEAGQPAAAEAAGSPLANAPPGEVGPHPLGNGRLANGRFGPGNPGRPPGSRNRMTQRLVAEILADFERNREQVLAHLRADHAAAYARLVARFLPPQTLAGLEDGPAPAPALAGLPRAALDEATARLAAVRGDVDWSRLNQAEQFLLHATIKARRAAEVAAALARENGENTVAAAESAGAERDLGPAER